MRKTRFAFLGLLAVLGTAPSAGAVNVAFFADPLYVDETPTGEAAHMRAAIESLGHTVTPFTGTTGPAWATALATADVFVLPENEDLSLADSLSSDARLALMGFLLRGNGAIINVDFQRKSYTLCNALFGWSVTGVNQDAPSTLNAASAAGTPFAGGPPTLPGTNATFFTTTSSLPPGALPMYEVGANTTVWAVTVGGSGRVVCTGYDWFNATNPPEWVQVLGNAITWVNEASGPSFQVALFNDPAFVDTIQEAARLRITLEAMGHTVTPFTGLTAAEWQAALVGADALVIPELQNADLFPALPPATVHLLAEHVLSGGAVLTNDRSTRVAQLLNGLFPGFAVSAASPTGESAIDNGTIPGTVFAAGPARLPASSAVDGLDVGTIPAGSVSYYKSGPAATLVEIRRGWGRWMHLGFDWFDLTTQHPWFAALNLSLQRATSPVLPTVTALATNAGADATITADLAGFQGLASATLRFRKGGDAPFQTAALSPALIPGTNLTERGVQMFVEATDGTSVGRFPAGAPASGRFVNLPVRLAGAPVASLPAGTYRLRGVPFTADGGASPTAVFDELGAYDIKKWRYGTFDGSGYREPDEGAANAVPGQGFWIIARNAADITSNGTSTNLSGPLTLTLRPGFNQIANPFNFPVDFADVVRPFEVEANLIGFDGSGYVGSQAVLQPGQGYWIKNNAAGNVTISIPPLGSGVNPAPRPPVELADGADWCLRLDAFAGSFADRGNLLGMRTGAGEGRDPFDLSEPPPAPSGWVRTGFASPETGELSADWRGVSGDGATWQVTFASDQHGEPFRIEIETERTLPEEWDVAVFEGAREVELGAERRITGTIGSTTAPRTFTVNVGSPAYLARARTEANASVTSFALGSPFPNPATVGVTVDLAVPQPVDDASVAVYDVQGRLVQTLFSGRVGQGVQRVAWDGRDASGLRAAAGVYFVKARAGEFTANRKVVLLP